MELSLDIQVDPATKRILSNPEKCRSELLDVTIVKSTNPELPGHTKITTLRADQVRKMVASLEKARKEKQKLLDTLTHDNTLVKIKKHEVTSPKNPKHKTRITPNSPVDDLERKDFIGIGESVEPLFCEIRRSLKNVETRITNMQDINLVISQTTMNATTSEEYLFYRNNKKPKSIPSTSQLIYRTAQNTVLPDLKSVLRCKKEKKAKEDKADGKCLCENCGIVGLLMECQQHPLLNELREAPPPEVIRSTKRKVPHLKDENVAYIQQLTKRIKQLEHKLAEQELNSVPKEYFNKVVSKIQPSKHQTSSECSVVSTKHPQSSRVINSSDNVRCLRNSLKSNLRNTRNPVKHEGTTTEDDAHAWRWGEEILKPGIDLKNRILNLVTDILSKFVITEKTSALKVPPLIPDSRKSSPVTTRKFESRDTSPRKVNPYANRKPAFEDNKKKCEEQMSREAYNLDVSYVNPKMNVTWKEDKPKSSAKEEFYKIISRAKSAQKEVLWRNIWNQAKANGQTKDDKITVKIPAGKHSGEMFETELAIREVEELLTKDL